MDILPVRFWSKVSVQPDGCWNWTAAKHNYGYGHFSIGGEIKKAHKLSYQHFKGEIADGLCVCHKCDNPSCVNPSHLWLGTHAENMDDRDAKGRNVNHVGETHGNSKLTEQDVRAIRADTRTYREIGADYGIVKSQVGFIKRRIQWAHLD